MHAGMTIFWLEQISRAATNPSVVVKAMDIEAQCDLNFRDCLIIAAAQLAGCDTLYSEDMLDGQVFEGRLTVINPFSRS